MDIKALRDFINQHPDGVIILMIDGAEYTLPHLDYVWFTPSFGKSEERAGRYATAFWLHDPVHDTTRLVNALFGQRSHGAQLQWCSTQIVCLGKVRTSAHGLSTLRTRIHTA